MNLLNPLNSLNLSSPLSLSFIKFLEVKFIEFFFDLELVFFFRFFFLPFKTIVGKWFLEEALFWNFRFFSPIIFITIWISVKILLNLGFGHSGIYIWRCFDY